MSLKTVIPVAIDIPQDAAAVQTALGSDYLQRITFARAIQGKNKPYIILNVGGADYESTTTQEDESAAYRIDYIAYADTVSKALDIHDALHAAIKATTSDTFDIRILDEDYFVDVDDVHRATISVVFRTNLT